MRKNFSDFALGPMRSFHSPGKASGTRRTRDTRFDFDFEWHLAGTGEWRRVQKAK